MRRTPPPYFEAVRREAEERWRQLERDPDLAGPWWQLFRQVQSPRHVLSELLQNADDAGATRARVSLDDGRFVFEHDGKDFDQAEFRSLCRFGFSNKRQLHTIGFRGIGFKSTFSLGGSVEVRTPSLAVRFHEQRFTEPVWIDDAPPCALTRISVAVGDQRREKELSKNLEEWRRSPVPLLFFNSIEELTIGGVVLRKREIGPGPLPGSKRIALSGHAEHEVLLFTSPEEPFPEEAVAEIRQERNVDDLDLPPCTVQLAAGLAGRQRLYVVLPTGVELDAPFSCNAPFIQDPDRSKIKSPSLSPTNRWLIERLGRLAGEAMGAWLGNEALATEERAGAYQLLPGKPPDSDSLEADVAALLAHAFAETVSHRPILLTTEGRLVTAKGCVAPPQPAYRIWTAGQLAQVFRDGAGPVLHGAVSDDARRRLASWGWLNVLDETDLVRRLEQPHEVPRPPDDAALLTLWELIQRTIGADYRGYRRRRMALIPVEGSEVLFRPDAVVRLPPKKEGIADEAWQLLVGLVRVVDPRFLHVLEGAGQRGVGDPPEDQLQAAKQLLDDVGLGRASTSDTTAKHACDSLLSRHDLSDEDLVTMAHLLAALDATAPATFRYVTRDGQRRTAVAGLIGTQDPHTEALLPDAWAAAHLLHDAYFRGHRACTRDEWQRWAGSEKSGLLPFVRLVKRRIFDGWGAVRQVHALLRSRGSDQQLSFYAQLQRVELADFGFPDELRSHWDGQQPEDAAIWAKVTERILSAPEWYWKDALQARMTEFNYTHNRPLGSPFPAEWLHDLKDRPSLYDVHGQPRVPAELLLRTPDTEPFQGVEPFVRADLDTDRTKPLLHALGVRATPTGLGSLLERLRALARAPDPKRVLGEIVKWYAALDRALVRADDASVAGAQRAFAREALVLAADHRWVRADEVFLQASEEYPDPPLVHPAVASLPMWTRLGVADRPTAELVLAWLKRLPSGASLDAEAQKRVTAALRRYPLPVWQTIGHWLALDGRWSPVATFRYRLGPTGPRSWQTLFPRVRAQTADLSMLDADARNGKPFADLPEIEAAIEHRLTRPPAGSGKTVEKPWLLALSRALARVRLADEAQTQRVREAAARLGRSVWQPFRADDPPEVTPYLDGVPAGPPQSRDVLWYGQQLFVRDGSVARSFDALAAELAAPFASTTEVADAIRACIERSPDFIAEYMEQHFEFDPDADAPTPVETDRPAPDEDPEGGRWRATEVAETEAHPGAWAQATLGDREGVAPPAGSERSVPRRPERSRPLFELFERFASGIGYRWDVARERFVRADGHWIRRTDSPFHWEEYDAAGAFVRRYWVSDQSLEGRGVEIGADVWGYFQKWPEACAAVVVDRHGRPRRMDGAELARRVREGRVRLYPATYRLREESGR
jgi:hypothetical protein